MRVWLLHIKPGHSTSLHKHMRKRSELCVLSGKARITTNIWYYGQPNEVRDTIDADNGKTYYISQGEPHKTEAIAEHGEPASADGVLMLETVIPPDKDDLVRLEDGYGRDSSYEKDVITSAAETIKLSDEWKPFLNWDIRLEMDEKFDIGHVRVCKANRIRVADYIFQYLAKKGVTHVFGVVGGGAMHLSDAVGNTAGITFVPCHHEQAAAMAAESYAHATGIPGCCMVTSGPGGTNAITGVVGAWIDSVPMIVVSGQVTRDTMGAGENGIRQMGIQEADICGIVERVVNDCGVLTNPDETPEVMQQAWHKATTGRQGPVWLDVPLDVQGAIIENRFEPLDIPSIPLALPDLTAVKERLAGAERPVIIAGRGIRWADAVEDFRALVDKLQIPVVTTWGGKDLLWQEHPLFIGQAGIMGDRAGNFAMQNADLLLILGSRMSIPQTGYNYATFAREAYKIWVDIDAHVLDKSLVNADMRIQADVGDFIRGMMA